MYPSSASSNSAIGPRSDIFISFISPIGSSLTLLTTGGVFVSTGTSSTDSTIVSGAGVSSGSFFLPLPFFGGVNDNGFSNEICFNSSLMNEMRMIQIRNELIRSGLDLGKYGKEEIFVHLISGYETLGKLDYSTKMNTDINFLLKLKMSRGVV